MIVVFSGRLIFQVFSGLPKSELCKLPRWLSVRVQTLPPVEAIEVVKFR